MTTGTIRLHLVELVQHGPSMNFTSSWLKSSSMLLLVRFRALGVSVCEEVLPFNCSRSDSCVVTYATRQFYKS